MERSYAARCARRMRELDAAASELVEICRSLGDVEAVYAFGSYGRGDVAPTSDLDILVVRSTTVRRVLRDRDIRLAYYGDIPLDIIVVTPDEFQNALPTTGMGATILRDARRLDAS